MTPETARPAPNAAPRLTADEAGKALERLVDRLRSLGLARLERAAEGAATTPAELAHATCTRWAAMVHGPHGPHVPALAASASGDQLAVIGREVVAAWREGRLTPADVEQVADDLAALRAAT